MRSMTMLFLSYSRKDQFFAELAEIKLEEFKIELWHDQGQLRAGDDWRAGIELGIDRSLAVLIALSENSVASSYVTFEWAYALGRRKVIIPVKLDNCSLHPRLEAVQHLDFSVPSARPWSLIAQRVEEIDIDKDAKPPEPPTPPTAPSSSEAKTVAAILEFLNERGYQMMSFERIRARFGKDLTDERLRAIVADNRTIFRPATLKGDKPGLAKLVP
jgi:hypothetical protein